MDGLDAQKTKPNLHFRRSLFVIKGAPKGAGAHLVGQLVTKSEISGSNPSPGQVSFSFLLCVHPALNGFSRVVGVFGQVVTGMLGKPALWQIVRDAPQQMFDFFQSRKGKK
ncbi:hypothetical protein PoB_004784400 [Plakobranchus ocellatus]|uniref:Uncharacterized protein n=1 Tax=Plakobranchus ocellatus TaxID=259542 RepID=A0AAV4BR75_9GAST|nr:hypothetical protein PoB_004784400 [Plakobranchus ocellatus]